VSRVRQAVLELREEGPELLANFESYELSMPYQPRFGVGLDDASDEGSHTSPYRSSPYPGFGYGYRCH